MQFDYISLAGAKAKGKRPQFFESSESEQLMAILMAVTGELAVTRERCDTLERLLEAKGLVSKQEIETFVPTTEQAHERALQQQEYIARVLRIVQQEQEAIAEMAKTGSDNALDDIIEELASS